MNIHSSTSCKVHLKLKRCRSFIIIFSVCHVHPRNSVRLLWNLILTNMEDNVFILKDVERRPAFRRGFCRVWDTRCGVTLKSCILHGGRFALETSLILPVSGDNLAVTHMNLTGWVMASGNRISCIYLKPDELENLNSYWTQISWRAQPRDHQARHLMYEKKIQSNFLFKDINPALL